MLASTQAAVPFDHSLDIDLHSGVGGRSRPSGAVRSRPNPGRYTHVQPRPAAPDPWHVHAKRFSYTTLAKKIVYSRDIHEVFPQCDHVISCDIDFNLQRELTTRRVAGRVDVEPKLDIARFHMIRLSVQPHEFLGCNDFFGQGSISNFSLLGISYFWNKLY